MKKYVHFIGALIALVVVVFLSGTTDVNAQTKKKLSGTAIRASKGDTVWVVLNHVKSDKREQFEKFIHEIFWPASNKLGPAEQQAFKQTRVLHPVEPNEDGTYTYVFLMDPVISGANYSILNYLEKMYGEKKAQEYAAMFNDALNTPQVGYTLVQSEY